MQGPPSYEEGLEQLDQLTVNLTANYIDKRWQIWRLRGKIYESLVGDERDAYKLFFLYSNRMSKLVANLHIAFVAMHELDTISHTLPNATVLALRQHLLQTIDMNLNKLHIAQLLILEKIQHLKRTELADKLIELKAQREIPYPEISLTSDEYKKLPPNLSAYLKSIPPIHASKHIKRSEKATDVINVAGAFEQLVATAIHFLPTLFSLIKGAEAFASAIPILAIGIAALTYTVNAVKAWMEDKSPETKAATLALAIIAGGAVVATGLAPAAFALISSGLIVLGTVREYVIPIIKTRREIAKQQDDIDFLMTLREKVLTRDQTLNTKEKHILIMLMEHKSIAEYDAQELVMPVDMRKQSLQSQLSKPELQRYFLQQIADAIHEKEKNIQSSRSQMTSHQRRLGVGAFTVIGAILLLIPTPPTLILGAILIAGTTLAGLEMKYHLRTRIKNYFTEKKAIPTPTEEKNRDSTFTLLSQLRNDPPLERKRSEQYSFIRLEPKEIKEEAKNNATVLQRKYSATFFHAPTTSPTSSTPEKYPTAKVTPPVKKHQ